MDPIRINVTVGLEEASIQRVAQILTTCIGGARPAAPSTPAPVEVRPAAPAAKPTPKPEPEPENIDNMTLNQAVKGAQARGVPADAIRAIFARYGIKSSRECPPEKRKALLDELNNEIPF